MVPRGPNVETDGSSLPPALTMAAAMVNPMNMDPESPRKIRAG